MYQQSDPDLSNQDSQSNHTVKSLPTKQLLNKYQQQLEIKQINYKMIPKEKFQSFKEQPQEDASIEEVIPVQEQLPETSQVNNNSIKNSSLFKISETDINQKFSEKIQKQQEDQAKNNEDDKIQLQYFSEEEVDQYKNNLSQQISPQVENQQVQEDVDSQNYQHEDEDFEEDLYMQPVEENQLFQVQIEPAQQEEQLSTHEMSNHDIIDQNISTNEITQHNVQQNDHQDEQQQLQNSHQEIENQLSNNDLHQISNNEILIVQNEMLNIENPSNLQNMQLSQPLENLKEVSSSFQSEQSLKQQQQQIQLQQQQTNLTSFHIDYTSQRVILENNESNSSSEIYNDKSFRMTQQSIQKKLSQELWVDADEMARSELARSLNRTKIYRISTEYIDLCEKQIIMSFPKEFRQLRQVQLFILKSMQTRERKIFCALFNHKVLSYNKQQMEVLVRKTLFKKEQLRKKIVFEQLKHYFKQRKQVSNQILKTFRFYRMKKIFQYLKMFVYENQAKKQMRLYHKNVLFKAMKKVIQQIRYHRDAKALSNYYYNAIGKCFMRWKKRLRVKKRLNVKFRKALLAITNRKQAFLFKKMKQFVEVSLREKEHRLQNYDPNQFIQVRLNISSMNKRK